MAAVYPAGPEPTITTSCTVSSWGALVAATGCAAGVGPPRMVRAWMGCDMEDVLSWSGRAVSGTVVEYVRGRRRRPAGGWRSEGADHHVPGPEAGLVRAAIAIRRAAAGQHGGGGAHGDSGGDDAAVGAQRLAVQRTVHQQPGRCLIAAPRDLLHDQDRIRDPLLPEAVRRVEARERLDRAGVDQALHFGAEGRLRDNGNAG